MQGESVAQVLCPKRSSTPRGPRCGWGRPHAAVSRIPPNTPFLGSCQQLCACQGENITPHPRLSSERASCPWDPSPARSAASPSCARALENPSGLAPGGGARAQPEEVPPPPPRAGQRTGGGDCWSPEPGALPGPSRRPRVPAGGRAPPPGHLTAVSAGPGAACAWGMNENNSKWRGGEE